MPYTLSIATEEDRDLVVASLRAAAEQRTRVARQAAGKVLGAGKDPRSASVKVVRILAEADTLEALAAELAATDELEVIHTAELGPVALIDVAPDGTEVALARLAVMADDPAPVGDGTGLSVEAQLAAARAELRDFDPDAPEDPVTGATAEDEPAQVEELDLDTPAPDEESHA